MHSCQFQIFLGKRGRGVGKYTILTNEGRGGPSILLDILCEQSLSSYFRIFHLCPIPYLRCILLSPRKKKSLILRMTKYRVYFIEPKKEDHTNFKNDNIKAAFQRIPWPFQSTGFPSRCRSSTPARPDREWSPAQTSDLRDRQPRIGTVWFFLILFFYFNFFLNISYVNFRIV